MYALEWFSNAESARIRSAARFYGFLDVRKKFQLFRKIFFSIDSFFWKYFWGFSRKNIFRFFANQNFQKSNFPFRTLLKCFIKNIFWWKKIVRKNIFQEKSQKIFSKKWIDRKNIFRKSWNFFRIKESVKSCCGSNARTLSVRKSL